MSSSQSIIQNYQASGEGTIRIPDFEIEVNGEKLFVKGKTLKVGPPRQRSTQRPDPFDPFEDFFNRRQEPTEYMEVEADAFLSLNTDKNEVYVGEGFTTTLAFYVSESNRADMRFYDLGSQLTKIVKDIKPDNCWEENFNIDNIVGESVQIRGKAYTQYKIYQATFYPLNDEDINFPGVDLKMIKYRVAKNPTYFGRNRQEDYEDFRSKPRTVTVKELPPHPLKDRVAVGNYRLKEKISSDELKTSQSFNYSFTITGEGNISSIEAPIINDRENFDFYEPNVTQNIRRSSNMVRGTKNFDYYVIPNEPGEYRLSDYINWIYFNTAKEQYDTLSSDVIVNVTGESRQNEYISSTDLGSFYDGIDFKSNELKSLNEVNFIKILFNIFIFAALAIAVFIVFKK
jgi:hypothetical protein